jgi:hypothetical protein
MGRFPHLVYFLHMDKEKWCCQTHLLLKPTHCFLEAGNTACEAEGCTVADHISELEAVGAVITLEWIFALCHSRCRISCFSLDNKEYLERVAQSEDSQAGSDFS